MALQAFDVGNRESDNVVIIYTARKQADTALSSTPVQVSGRPTGKQFLDRFLQHGVRYVTLQFHRDAPPVYNAD